MRKSQNTMQAALHLAMTAAGSCELKSSSELPKQSLNGARNFAP